MGRLRTLRYVAQISAFRPGLDCRRTSVAENWQADPYTIRCRFILLQPALLAVWRSRRMLRHRRLDASGHSVMSSDRDFGAVLELR